MSDQVEIVGLSDEKRTTVVTGVEMFRKLLDFAEAGDNVGLLLRGIQRTDIERGQVPVSSTHLQQALRVTPRLVFPNRTGTRLDRVLFAVYANQFRRQSTVMYEDAEALYAGYLPGGVEFFSVAVNGRQAEWAVQGDGEWYRRVKCDRAPEERCEFTFVYDVLLTENAGCLGTDGDAWRLSGFYPTRCVWENGVWAANDLSLIHI